MSHLDAADHVLVVFIGIALVCGLIAFFVVVAASAARVDPPRTSPPPRRTRRRRATGTAPAADLVYSRTYDLFRDLRNETTATDAGLLGILAAVAAVIVLAFANDAKIGSVSTALLYLSFMACAVGFGWGRWPIPEQEKPLEFLLDFFEDPDRAQRDAAQDLVLRLKPADLLLKVKRRWALAAVALLVLGMLSGGLHRVL